MTAAIMVQGVGSNTGKSILVAGLCRYFAKQGVCCAPFKPQNMSNNAAVTADGGEIGRAQMLQARAAMISPLADMNPVLLKPETDQGAQIIVQGQRFATMQAAEYGQHKAKLMPKVLESFERLKKSADLIIVEGAGSPAETNLRDGDIANMGFAECVDIPVILIGDIDRGGVIASLIGTHAVLDRADAARIKGFLINKFRGDKALFEGAMTTISEATGWSGLGILPWFDDARKLPAEDILDLERKHPTSPNTDQYHVAVPVIRRIANFDDIDPLIADPAFRVTLVHPGQALPLDADMVLLPGSKSSRTDLSFLIEQGWHHDLTVLLRHGRKVIGLCGGFQMLGNAIHDPDGIEGEKGTSSGLGLLDIETTLTPHKTLTHSSGLETSTGAKVSGYEIHLGTSDGVDSARPMIKCDDGREDGASDQSGQVAGCYMHGIFASDTFRAAWLTRHGHKPSDMVFEAEIDSTLDSLAKHISDHIDLDRLALIAGL